MIRHTACCFSAIEGIGGNARVLKSYYDTYLIRRPVLTPFCSPEEVHVMISHLLSYGAMHLRA